MLLGNSSSEHHEGDSQDGSLSMLHQDKKAQTTLFAQRALQERRLKPPDQVIACPRCQSLNTKFCYYNNYSLTQPRHFCKNCRRYWTAGGTLRNVPVGGGCRKNKRSKQRSSELSSVLAPIDPSSASTSAGYYDHQYEEATKLAIARAQIRGGPSNMIHGVDGPNGHVSAFHVTSNQHGVGMSHSSHPSFETPSMINLAFFQPQQAKQEVGVMANGDLSSMFEAQNYRAATAAAAAAGGGPPPGLGEGGMPAYNIELDIHNMDSADAQWRLQAQHAQQSSQKQQGMWGDDEQGQRERRKMVSNVDEKGLMENLRQAKGKWPIVVSQSSGHDQSENPGVGHSNNVPAWQQVPESMQSFEQVSHDTTFWANQAWPPLDNIHALNQQQNT